MIIMLYHYHTYIYIMKLCTPELRFFTDLEVNLKYSVWCEYCVYCVLWCVSVLCELYF